ncbi:MAG: hypothetical protein QXO93_04950 [Acidilobaceae archaeon]
MGSKGPVAKLAEAISWFEVELRRAYDEATYLSNELVKFSDVLIREFEADINNVLNSIVSDLRSEASLISEKLRQEYSRRVEEELRIIDSKARANFGKAVDSVVEEIKKILGEV